jgi:DNA primase
MQGDAKEEVRSKLNIEDVIGEYVQLKRAGRNFKGLSPFSGEKSPSFFVSPEKNIWHDFSSNKGGDVFSFVMEAEGLDFRQALEHLARKAGVDLSLYEDKNSQQLAARKKKLFKANELATKYYQQSMLKNKAAIDYIFKKRGLSKQVVQDFRIGYAPDTGNALVNTLIKRDFSKKELTDAGLTNRYGGDMFRGRMTVPLMDAAGQVIGFTGRILQDIPNAPKYLNTPATLLYDKSRHIFGLSQAKEAIRTKGYVVAVEGNLDVISSHQAGVKQTVATAGTAMTEHHLRALKRLTTDVRLAYDGDKAGIAATERAIGLASPMGIDLTIISLPDGAKDPDELIKQDKTAWQRAIDEAVPAVDWILNQYQQRVDVSSATGKRTFTTAALNVIKALDDPVERDHYEQKVAQIIGSSLSAIQQKASDSPASRPELKQVKAVTSEAKPDYSHQDDALAVAAIDGPSQELFRQLDLDILVGEDRQALARYLAKNAGKPLDQTPPDLQKHDDYVKMVLLRAEARYADMSEQDRFYETARLIRQIENEYKKQKRDNLTKELREAESAHDDLRADEIRQQLNVLIKEIARGR